MAAIRTRLTGDTGTGGLFDPAGVLVTGVYGVHAPQASNSGAGAVVPYILLVPVAAPEEKVFVTTTYAIDHIIQVSIYTDADLGSEPPGIIATRVRARLDRWTPTVSGWSPSPILREDGQLFEDEGNFHQVETYRAYMAKV